MRSWGRSDYPSNFSGPMISLATNIASLDGLNMDPRTYLRRRNNRFIAIAVFSGAMFFIAATLVVGPLTRL
jgi:hypothetical protein